MPPSQVQRVAWTAGFPDVIVHTSVGRRDGHPDYDAAKRGQRAPAARLARALVSPAAIAGIRDALGSARPILVPVRAIEVAGINFIPDAMAEEIALALGLPVTRDLEQVNTVGHTRANGFRRLVFQPEFDGPVTQQRSHVLVDDHVGLGSTLANLRGHIEHSGGHVVLTTTLSASRNSEVLALRPATLHALRQKHGSALEDYWQRELGFSLDLLTEAEAGYLGRTPSLDAIRAGVAAERGA